MKLYEIFRNGTQHGTIEARSLKEARGKVFAQYGKTLDIQKACLFEYPERWSGQLTKLMDTVPEEPSHQELKQLKKQFRVIGYTFEFGLDATPFNLREIKS